MKYFFLSTFVFLSMQTDSYAYLDPATLLKKLIKE